MPMEIKARDLIAAGWHEGRRLGAALRRARDLEGHMRAGAELLVDAVKSALPPENATVEMRIPTLEGTADRFTTATHMLPGFEFSATSLSSVYRAWRGPHLGGSSP